MEFTNETLTRGEPYINADLFLNYDGKKSLNVTIGSKGSNVEDSIILIVVYTLTFHTTDNKLIQKYIGIYAAKVIKGHLSIVDEKIELWKHIRNGLILSSNDANSGDTSLQKDILSELKWKGEIDMAYNELIGCWV